MPKKYYVVWEGRQKGVFSSWDVCKESVTGFQGAVYKSFESYDEAIRAYESLSKKDIFKQNIKTDFKTQQNVDIIRDSIAVDAACSGNPGDMEYRGVYVKTGQEIFKLGPFKDGTNNVGEFLAIVHGLAYLKQRNISVPLYSDSITAISWVRKKMCNTKLEATADNTQLFELIERAEKWLQSNNFSTPILKWNTGSWGEIPADFGRK